MFSCLVDIPAVESCLQHFFCTKNPEWNATWVKELTKQKPPPPFLLCSFSGQCKIAFHFLYMFFFGGRGTCFVFFRCWLQWLYDSGSIKIVIPKPEIFISPKSWRKVTSSILNAGKVILHPLKMESSLDFWKAFGLHELNKKTSKAWAHVPAPVARYWRVLGGFG